MNVVQRTEMVRNGSHVPTPALLDRALRDNPDHAGSGWLIDAILAPREDDCRNYLSRLLEELKELGSLQCLKDNLHLARIVAYPAFAHRDIAELANVEQCTQAISTHDEITDALRHYARLYHILVFARLATEAAATKIPVLA